MVVGRQETLAEALIDVLKAHGVERLFGIPGGGSSLDLIAAAGRADLEFVLCRTENAAAIIAAVTGELTGAPGVALAGIGPGAASIVNGVAYASLERAPLIVITDAKEPGADSLHQAFNQGAMFAPVSKASVQLTAASNKAEVRSLVESASNYPAGPVHIDLSAEAAAGLVTEDVATAPEADTLEEGPALEKAVGIMAAARRPAIIAGHECRTDAAAVVALAESCQAPVLATYKAKGVMPEEHALFVGMFTGAEAEAETLRQADVILLCGFDLVEMIPTNWAYDASVISINRGPDRPMPAEPAIRAWGEFPGMLVQLSELMAQPAAVWSPAEIADLRDGMRRRSAAHAPDTLNSDSVVEMVLEHVSAPVRVTVDAGAHMFSVMNRWPARKPNDVLKSNGLSTMGYALPAAIASALYEPELPVIAFTGDGGLMMCVAELSTMARLKCNIMVVVLNDAALSLIDVKQQRRQDPSSGVRYPAADFAAVAQGFGVPAWRVEDLAALNSTITKADSIDGPKLIDIRIDPAAYGDQLTALRG